MLDFNQSQSTAGAVERIRRLQDFDLTWVEEPVAAEDLVGHRAVRERVRPVPIQTGENWWFPHGMANAIAAGASDLAMIDIMKIGGVTGWMAAMAQAEAAALPLSNHTLVEPSAVLLSFAVWAATKRRQRPAQIPVQRQSHTGRGRRQKARLLKLLQSSDWLAHGKRVEVTLKGSQMQPNEPTPAQIDLIRKLVRSVNLENSHAEYDKASLQFTSREEFQAALRFVELEIQQHLTLIEHWHHLAKQ